MEQSTKLFSRSMGRWLMALLLVMVTSLAARAVEAYACYTPSNTTLTFYYDNSRSSRTGTTYDLNTSINQPGWKDDGVESRVTQVKFDSSFANARPSTTFFWFNGMSSLQSIQGMEYLNTSEVKNMTAMFNDCSSLTSLDLSHFNTAKVSTMYAMFSGCSGLRAIDVSGFNTSSVTDMTVMFYDCPNLTSLDLSSFNTSRVTKMQGMFYGNSNLHTIYVGSNWSTEGVTDSSAMFADCTSLVGGRGTTYDGSHVDKAYAHIDGGPSNPGYFTDPNVVPEAYACYTPSNTTLTFYYDTERSSRTGTTYDLPSSYTTTPDWIISGTNRSVTKVVFNQSFATHYPSSTSYWFFNMENLQSITGLGYLNTSEVTSMIAMFGGCHALTSVDLSGFNTANVTNMNSMFYDCPSLTSLNVSGFNTSNVTDMMQMFYNCSSLTSLDVSHFNTAKVTQMAGMFNGCSALTSLDLSNFNTAKVTDMNNMFNGCSALTSLNVSNFNTANVTDMSCMFAQCESLNSLDVSNFNTAKVSNMNCMFMYLRSLTRLDLSSFNTSNVTEMAEMFLYCPMLKTIYVSDSWTTAAVTSSSDMFYGCYRLTGQMGTTFNANYTDKAYAHIDGGTSNPGYFSARDEAYACYTTANNGTLTFYYDTQRSSRTGTTYDLNTGDNVPGWSDLHEDIHHVIFDPSFADARPTSTYFWFYNFEDPEFIGLNYLNTSEVTNMSGMFGFLHYLESIDVSHFDTSKVTDMSEMFEYTTLTSLDLSSFNTSNVTDMSLMFCESQSLQTIYVGEGWTTAAVTSSAEMFSNCTSLVGGHGTSYDANHVDKAYAHLDGGTSNPGYFTDINAPAEPEAYACYTPSNTTLTFYYDTDRSIRMGTTYDLNTGYNTPGWYNDGTRANVTKVVFDSSFADTRPISTYRWFNGMSNLTSITNITKLNTYYVTNMGYMFAGCSSLTSLNLSNFSTSNVIDMNYMFYGCEKLQSLNLGYNFAATNVTEMTGMFQNCKSLRSLDLNRFSTSQVTSMSKMFNNCVNLTTITVGRNWSAAAVTNSSDMFLGCTSLVGGMGTTYNSNHIDKAYAHVDGGSSNPGYLTGNHEAYACYTPSNTTLSFYYDGQWSNRPGSVYYVNMVTGYANPSWYGAGIASSVTHVVIDPSMAGTLFPSTYRWFANMSKLVSITGLNYLKTSMTTNMGSMFQDCSRLTSLDLSNFITTSVEDMRYMFAGCSNLVTVYVGNGWSTAATTTSNSVDMFQGCTKIRGEKGTTYSSSHTNKLYARIDGGTSNPGYFTTGNEAYACYTPSNTTLTFYYDKQRSSRTGTTYRLNTGTSNPGWYSVRASVTKVVFTPSFAEALPTSTYYWFYEMTNLTSISGLNYLNTSAVTNMAYMFYRCSQLTSLDLSGFNTAKVISMSNMFNGCNRLTSLDLSSFNTANVTHMTNMFYSCSKLTSLDLSSFNTANVTNMASMFRSCTGLVTIYAGSEWSTAAATLSGNMFTGCSKLVGGMGTTYDANHVDAAYAHIDGGPSNPGYFSALFIRGDVDNNGEIKIADVTALINYLLSGDASAINLQAADCDQNGEIKIGDVTALINYLLSGSW